MQIHKTFSPWTSCYRNILFLTNVIFGLTAGALIATACEISRSFNNYQDFMDIYCKLPVQITIAIGVILLLSTLLCWYGVIKLHSMSLHLYFSLLLALAIVTFATSVAAFVAYKGIEDVIEVNMFHSIKAFDGDVRVRNLWHDIQNKQSCCGVHYPENWYNIKEHGVLLEHRGFTRKFPHSCCVGSDCTKGLIYERGCANSIINEATSNEIIIAGITMLLVACQLATAMVTFLFTRRIEQPSNGNRQHRNLQGKSIVLLSEHHSELKKPAFV